MDVTAANNSQQMQQMQMQMRKMDGSGNGQGQGGMKDIMQQLSTEDRTALQEQMSSLSQTDRASMVSQMQQVDATTMTSDEYAQTLLDMFDQENSTNRINSAAYDFSIYV